MSRVSVRRARDAIIVVAIVLTTSRAFAAPPDRVLLADPDPELLRAVESSLSPWHLAVVVDASVPRDEPSAHARADATGARFVVWRDGDQLVVFDRARDASERRPASAGRFDPVTAATAALTVKTMMRLPPLEDSTTVVAPPVVGPRAPEPSGGLELRIEAGAAARVGSGGLGGRGVLAVMVRPSSHHGWRFGVRGDLGTKTTVDRSGFKGTWTDLAVLAAASWTYERGPWELEPWVAGGITWGSLDGTEASAPRTESGAFTTVRGGGYLRRRLGALTGGLGLEVVGTPSAPTYTRSGMGMSAPTVFEAPRFSVVIGLGIAVDLGR